MTDRESFLHALRAAPHDDRVRLVFADWLDEHDEPEPAARIRRWVMEIKPRAVEAWFAETPAPDFEKSWLRLRTQPKYWWMLSVLLAKRLDEYDSLKELPEGEEGRRHWEKMRGLMEDERHTKECIAFGLQRRSAKDIKQLLLDCIRQASVEAGEHLTEFSSDFAEAFAAADESDEPSEFERRSSRLYAAVYQELTKNGDTSSRRLP